VKTGVHARLELSVIRSRRTAMPRRHDANKKAGKQTNPLQAMNFFRRPPQNRPRKRVMETKAQRIERSSRSSAHRNRGAE